MCLLCERVFSNEAMEPSRLLEHLKKIHPDKVDKTLAYLQSIRENLQKRKTIGNMFASTSQHSSDGLRASYNISLLIAKSGKPHTIGEELILPAVSEVLRTGTIFPAQVGSHQTLPAMNGLINPLLSLWNGGRLYNKRKYI